MPRFLVYFLGVAWGVFLPLAHANNVGTVLTQATSSNTSTNVYTIQAGDTLWDISRAFMGNPDAWPDLWSINDYITNPHWIYPGNQIVFTMGTLLDPPKIDLGELDTQDGYTVKTVSFEASERTCGPDLRFNSHQPTTLFTVPGFLKPHHPKDTDDDIEIVGKVTNAPRNQSFMVEQDLIYIKLDDPSSYGCGDVVTLLKQVKKRVHKPGKLFQSYGSIYQILGDARIVHHYGDYVTAEVRTSWAEIDRGSLVTTLTPAVVQMEIDVPNGDLQGKIIERLAQHHYLIGTRDIVFLNRGKTDGVSAGDSFYVITQKDEFISWDKQDNNLPPTVIGRIVVVRTSQDTSVAVVTDAARALHIGDRISMTAE